MAVSTWQPILAPVPDAAPTPAGLIALHPGYTPFAGATLAEDPAATPANAALTASLRGLLAVDAVGVERRAAALASRSIKTTAKAQGISLAVSMIDLTTLEGSDTPGKVRSLCRKAVLPDPADPALGPVAAVCVYPDLVATAVTALAGSPVHVASVATAFPAGRASLRVRCADTADALAAGATEIDMVINIGKALSGDWPYVEEDIRAVCDEAHAQGARVKVILENDYLAQGGAGLSADDLKRRLCELCEQAGADWVKTSTGYGFVKQPDGSYNYQGATEHDLALMRASVSPKVQVKAAGGVRDLDGLLRVRQLGATRCGATATVAILKAHEQRLAAANPIAPLPPGQIGQGGY